jgi:hypothetical protein
MCTKMQNDEENVPSGLICVVFDYVMTCQSKNFWGKSGAWPYFV